MLAVRHFVAAENANQMLFMENEHYQLVDALPYIDTQLGQTEVAQQVKALIEEEMEHFVARDYLAPMPAPELPLISSEAVQAEFARVEGGRPMEGIDIVRYKVEPPQGVGAQDYAAWRGAAESVHMQLEYNRLRLTNLEMLERWGNKAWIAHTYTVRGCEAVLQKETAALKAEREAVNKKRKLDQVSCGNELRKLTLELEQYQRDNAEVELALYQVESDVQRVKKLAKERSVEVRDLTGEAMSDDPKPDADDKEPPKADGDAKEKS